MQYLSGSSTAITQGFFTIGTRLLLPFIIIASAIKLLGLTEVRPKQSHSALIPAQSSSMAI